MDRPRTLPGTPVTRAALRGARVFAWLLASLGAVGALWIVLTWLGVRSLERARFSASSTQPSLESVRPQNTWTSLEVEYQSRGARIAGRLHLPAGPGPHPALVVAHGSGPARRDNYGYLATPLAARGWALLVYDKRGVGDSEGDYSSIGPANSESMFDLLASDVVAGAEYLATRNDVDARRIGVFGISQGGWIGPLAASRSSVLSFLVIVSGPAVSVGEEIHYSELTGEREGAGRLLSDAELSTRLGEFAGPHGFDPVPVLRSLEVPGLWILGAEDRSIPIPETVARLEELVAAGSPFKLHVLPAIGHGMRDVTTGAPAPVSTIAADWLDAITERPSRRERSRG